MVRTNCGACVWLVAGIVAAMGASPVDESKPYGRVAIGVVTGEKERPLEAQSKPGDDTFIVAHAEASEHCQLLIFALSARDGKLAHNWRPQFVDLPQWEEVQLPETPVVWKWPEASGAVNIYVLFLHPNSKEARELKALVTASQRLGYPWSGIISPLYPHAVAVTTFYSANPCSTAFASS